MARKTNKEFSLMSMKELESYASNHPAEAGRISKLLANSSAKIFKVSVRYIVSGNLKPMEEMGAIQPVF